MPGRDELQVRAHRRDHVGADPGDLALLRRRELERRDDVATVDRRQRILRPLLDPLHRPAEPAGERDREELLGVDVELRAEAAADVGCDDPQLRLGQAERRRGEDAQDVRDLGGRPERHVSTRLRPREHATRLDRVRDQPRLHVAVLDDDVGALVESAARELPDVRDVRAELPVGEGRAVLRRCLHVDDRVERLVGDLDELRGVDRVRARVGDHDRDAVSLVARLADGEREVRPGSSCPP